MSPHSPDFLASVAKALERGLPITPEPFAEIARELGAREASVLEAVALLKASGLFRHFGAFVDFRAIGLCGSLFGVRADAVEALCEWLRGLRYVTHIYERASAVNLWFTAILPGCAAVAALSEELNARGYPHASLLAERRIKLASSFASPAKVVCEHETIESPDPPVTSLEPAERELLIAAQENFPISARPFAGIGKSAGLSEERALESLCSLASRGVLRRIGASLHHLKAGYAFNSLIAWDLSGLPDEEAARAGRRAARYSWVSHCYLRRTIANTLGVDWGYNLYTMIHARDGGELKEREGSLFDELRGYPFLSMKTTCERKKTVFQIERGAEQRRRDDETVDAQEKQRGDRF